MFLITPRMAGTRTAPPQATLGTLRNGPTPVTPGQQQSGAPAPQQPATPGQQTVSAPNRVAAPAPAPAPAPVAAPPTRASVVVDLDAMPSSAPQRPSAPPAATPPSNPAPGARVAMPGRINTSQP
jgi:hypothetical protein